MTEFREILVLGAGRSGSNLLCSILRSMAGNAGFFEIMKSDASVGLNNYPAVAARLHAQFGPFGREDDPALVAARDADPAAFFAALSAATAAEGHASMTCKIFGNQIRIPDLDQILTRPNLGVIFLSRTRIDRYISGQKGHLTKAYVKEDYTELRPTLDVAQFLRQASDIDRHYDAMLDSVRKSDVRHSLLDYDQDLDIPADRRGDRIAAALSEIGFAPPPFKPESESWLSKQDKNDSWRAKVANGFETGAALAGLGLLDYAEASPLDDRLMRPRAMAAQVCQPRDDGLLDQGGYNLAISADPAVTFTAIQFDRSFLAEWMAGPEPALPSRKGVHFLKPTWSVETTNLRPLAESVRLAEACNPGHSFVALHVSDREAAKYREVGIRSIACNTSIFINEAHFAVDGAPHPDLPDTAALYIARLAGWKNHELAVGLDDPLFVYGNPVEAEERAQFDKLRSLFPATSFVNHRLGGGAYHYLNRSELASVMSRSRVALALSREEGAMRAAVECLMAGLPIVSVPSVGGRDQLFTADTALIVEPTPEAVRAGVADLLARNIGRDAVRKATLALVEAGRRRFLDAGNRVLADLLGPTAPRLAMEPLLDFTIRYHPLRNMIETLR